MITFKQYITELFDKPYNAKERESNLRPTDYGGNMGQQTFEAKTKDGDTLGIRFGHFSSKPSKAFSPIMVNGTLPLPAPVVVLIKEKS